MKHLKIFIWFALPIVILTILLDRLFSDLLGGWRKDWKEDKENQILFANYDGGISGITIEMLQNGIFRVGDGSFMGIKYEEGTFEIVKDTIIFNKDLIGGNKAVLRYNSVTRDTFLFVVHPNNKLDGQTPYRVHSQTNKTKLNVPILDASSIEFLKTNTCDSTNQNK
jgi:hypothetical protein